MNFAAKLLFVALVARVQCLPQAEVSPQEDQLTVQEESPEGADEGNRESRFFFPFPFHPVPNYHIRKVYHKSAPIMIADNKMIDRLLGTETASAIDAAAARVTNVFGDVIENIGSFLVERVEDLPEAIEKISHDVGEAVHNGGEKVVIIVKGIRTNPNTTTMTQTMTQRIHTIPNPMENILNKSQTGWSLRRLGEKIGQTFGRIASVFHRNMNSIDKAVAGGIRRVIGIDRHNFTNNSANFAADNLDEFTEDVPELDHVEATADDIPAVEEETYLQEEPEVLEDPELPEETPAVTTEQKVPAMEILNQSVDADNEIDF